MTHESKHLIEQLQARIERNEARAASLAAQGHTVSAAVCKAWADATRLCLEDVEMAAPWIEQDAAFAARRAS